MGQIKENDEKDDSKGNKSSPLLAGSSTVAERGSRRRYVSGNHLLNFEVSSSVDTWTSHSATLHSPQRYGGRSTIPFTKERFIHANFRFVTRREMVGDAALLFKTNPDARLEWGNIELVIVPAQQDLSCPICLDIPLAPRLTKCGHFFCWPCILRYASANSAAGAGNWRKCPICFESFNVNQLKSVYFCQVTDFTTPGNAQAGIPMVLLAGNSSNCQVFPVEKHLFNRNPKSLEELNPFEKVTFVDRQFVIDCIIELEALNLRDRLAMLDDKDPDQVYTELAITMVEDRRNSILCEGSAPLLEGKELMDSKVEMATAAPPLFFHQSSDGQPFFLSPQSIKILRREFGRYELFPKFLCAPVIEIEMLVMSEELRRRHRQLRYLPIGCQFGLCDVDLTGVVSSSVLAEFSTELQAKATARKIKASKEEKLAAAALQREHQQRVATYAMEWNERSTSPVPGVAMGLFNLDYENFPAPPNQEQPESTHSNTIPIKSSSLEAPPMMRPLASSFASVAAASPPSDSFLVISGAASVGRGGMGPSPSAVFEFSSFEDLPSDPPSESSKKGKRTVLISNVQRRLS